jgi:hypothetical protein
MVKSMKNTLKKRKRNGGTRKRSGGAGEILKYNPQKQES